MNPKYSKSLEEVIEELDIVDKKVDSLIALDKRLRTQTEITMEDAIEIDNAIPGGKTLSNQFSVTNRNEQYIKSLEEIDLAIIGAIVAGVAILAYAIHRIYKYFATGTKDGGGGGSDELPSPEKIDSIRSEHLENNDDWERKALPIVDKLSELGLVQAITDYARSNPPPLAKFTTSVAGLGICTSIFGSVGGTPGDAVIAKDIKGVSQHLTAITNQFIKDVSSFYQSRPDDDSTPIADHYKKIMDGASQALADLHVKMVGIKDSTDKKLNESRNYEINSSHVRDFSKLMQVADNAVSRLELPKKITLAGEILKDMVERTKREKEIGEHRNSYSIKEGSVLDKAIKSPGYNAKTIDQRFINCEKALMTLVSYLQKDNLQFIQYKTHFLTYVISMVKEMQTEFKRGADHGPHFHEAMMKLNNEAVKDVLTRLEAVRQELIDLVKPKEAK